MPPAVYPPTYPTPADANAHALIRTRLDHGSVMGRSWALVWPGQL